MLAKKAIMCHNRTTFTKSSALERQGKFLSIIIFLSALDSEKTAKNMKNHNDKQMLFWGLMIFRLRFVNELTNQQTGHGVDEKKQYQFFSEFSRPLR